VVVWLGRWLQEIERHTERRFECHTERTLCGDGASAHLGVVGWVRGRFLARQLFLDAAIEPQEGDVRVLLAGDVALREAMATELTTRPGDGEGTGSWW